MSPEGTVPLGGDEPLTDVAEFRPAEYLAAIREAMHTEEGLSKRAPSTRLAANMYFEEERSRLFLADHLEQTEIPGQDEESLGWLQEGFVANMTRLVKVSARAADKGHPVSSFAELPEEQRDAVRARLFDEYVEVCQLLSPGGRFMKYHCDLAPIFYQGPQDMHRLIEERGDLTAAEAARLIVSYPSNPEPVFEEVRAKIALATKKYPTVSQSEIRRIVASTKDSYEAAIARHAEKHGLSLEQSPDDEDLTPELFLSAARKLVRSGSYRLGHLNPTPQAREEAEEIAEEAGTTVDDSSTVMEQLALHENGPAFKIFKAGFQHRMKVLALLSDRAWRRGDMPKTLSQRSEEFRHSLYALALGEFALLQAEMSEEVTKFSVKNNPVLQIAPETLRTILAANQDLARNYVVRLIVRNPIGPEAAIADFRQRVAQIMESDPRLLESEAKYIAMSNPRRRHQKKPQPERQHTPAADLLPAIRVYLNSSARLGQATSRDIKFEIEARRDEVRAFYETQGWTFAGIELPSEGRTALMKKFEEFVIASERAYRKKEMEDRLRDYTADERRELYLRLATDFSISSQSLEVESDRAWNLIPVLYISPGELEELRSQYSEFHTSQFNNLALTSHKDLPEALRRAAQLKNDLQQWYPGVTPALATQVSLQSPLRAEELVLDHLQRVTRREFERFDSRVGYPNAKRPHILLTNLRTQFKHRRLERFASLPAEVSEAIAELQTRAADWLAGHAPGVDGETVAQFGRQLHRYVLGSESLAAEGRYPRITQLSYDIQNRLISMVYENHQAVSERIAEISGGEKKLRITEFGFYHTADYLDSLVRQYESYFSPNLIVYAALTSPRMPFTILNQLVERRAELVKSDADITPHVLQSALTRELQSLAGKTSK